MFGELIFFRGPVAIQLISNVVFFILTSEHCSKVKAEIRRVADPSDPKSKRFHADKTKWVYRLKHSGKVIPEEFDKDTPPPRLSCTRTTPQRRFTVNCICRTPFLVVRGASFSSCAASFIFCIFCWNFLERTFCLLLSDKVVPLAWAGFVGEQIFRDIWSSYCLSLSSTAHLNFSWFFY